MTEVEISEQFDKMEFSELLKKPERVFKEDSKFDLRRQLDPQGLIDDLIGQTWRQAKAIHEKNKEIKELTKELEKLKKKAEKDGLLN